MIDITSDKLTRMEKRIYKSIVLEGCSISDLMRKYCLTRGTIATHLNNICHKRQVWGNNRIMALFWQFWGGFLACMNCSKCQYNIQDKCCNSHSQFYGESFGSLQRSQSMLCDGFCMKEQQ